MDILLNFRQWIFERTIPIIGMAALGILYQVGMIWYDNAMMISSAYGI